MVLYDDKVKQKEDTSIPEEERKAMKANFEECFFAQLLKWFKFDFFAWPEANPPSIYSAGALCDGAGSQQANEEEAIWG